MNWTMLPDNQIISLHPWFQRFLLPSAALHISLGHSCLLTIGRSYRSQLSHYKKQHCSVLELLLQFFFWSIIGH